MLCVCEGERENTTVLIYNQSKYISDTEFPYRRESEHRRDCRGPEWPTNSILHPGSLHHRQEMHLTETMAGEVPI